MSEDHPYPSVDFEDLKLLPGLANIEITLLHRIPCKSDTLIPASNLVQSIAPNPTLRNAPLPQTLANPTHTITVQPPNLAWIPPQALNLRASGLQLTTRGLIRSADLLDVEFFCLRTTNVLTPSSWEKVEDKEEEWLEKSRLWLNMMISGSTARDLRMLTGEIFKIKSESLKLFSEIDSHHMFHEDLRTKLLTGRNWDELVQVE